MEVMQRLLLVPLLLLMMAAPFARAQSVGASVGGVVVDESGAAIPGATVRITTDRTGVIVRSRSSQPRTTSQ
jgi:hypothetical protein